ncbi:MAG TPA: acyl-CoA dehydrogenase, partial [Jatrophihabitans sp.]|nr:acyl-CoA dehydrogenase [Jatrophihabitans sp.]
MAINLELPKKFGMLINQAHQVSTEIFRPISRKYDRAEHEYPKELDMLASLIDGMNASGETSTGAGGVRRDSSGRETGNRNGTNMSGVMSVMEA